VADDIRALSALLAHDPASLVYARLAEALRRRGDFAQALQVATQGLMRHPEHVDGLDCLGRIHADRGDLAQAKDAWDRALAVAPSHGGALKGMAFAVFREGDAHGAAALLERALAASPADEAARRALDTVRRAIGDAAPVPPGPAPEAVPRSATAADAGAPEPAARADEPPLRVAEPAPRRPERAQARPPVFRGMEGSTADILLFDDRGLVVAGGLTAADGSDVSELAAAALAGVSGEATRTAGYLGLGGWEAIVAEADRANLVLAPVGPGALLLVRRDRSVPVGLTLRVAERAQAAARAWLERQGA
jgi:tetratricopeptide (TPR) repeat protein